MGQTDQFFERYLEQVCEAVPHPDHGIYGPDSMMWQLSRETILFLCGGRAALLQTAHPFVAHAVDQHSQTKTDLSGRFQRTFSHVFAMSFGPLDEALTSARRVHAIHQTVRGRIQEDVGPFSKGTPYEANTPEALLWVFATLIDSAVQAFELIVRPLTPEEKEQLYEESRLFCYLFGIPDDVRPSNWSAFQAYMNDMFESEVLTVGEVSQELCNFLFRAPRPMMIPAWRWYKVLTTGLLPPRTREQYGLRFGRREQWLFRSSLIAIRRIYRNTPGRLRFMPAYIAAQRRLAHRTGPDPIAFLWGRLARTVFKQKGN